MDNNINSGVFFRNEKKTAEKQPDYTGNINIEGKEYRLAAWVKTSQNGKKFLSIKASEPTEEKVFHKGEPTNEVPRDLPF